MSFTLPLVPEIAPVVFEEVRLALFEDCEDNEVSIASNALDYFAMHFGDQPELLAAWTARWNALMVLVGKVDVADIPGSFPNLRKSIEYRLGAPAYAAAATCRLPELGSFDVEEFQAACLGRLG